MWFSLQLGSASMYCPFRLYSGAHPHTVGKIISTPRPCQGSSAFVIDGIPFSLFLLFPLLQHTLSLKGNPHWLCVWCQAQCISEIHFLPPLSADLSKNPILLFDGVNEDRGPSLRAQGYWKYQHKVPCLRLHSLTRTQACTGTGTLFYSFTLQAINRHTPECPDPWYNKIDTIASMTAEYQSSQSRFRVFCVTWWRVLTANQMLIVITICRPIERAILKLHIAAKNTSDPCIICQ